mmetsp:Transcript_81524/g.228689  ORF Transcript_81524/g.228689 Transcript_81524/m.228689 type:complete len:86 (-) Transcript_81524:21-278(-)
MLRSDGRATPIGQNRGQCDAPDLQTGAEYTQVAAGKNHTVMLRSDGRVVYFKKRVLAGFVWDPGVQMKEGVKAVLPSALGSQSRS